jgi:hypothetical protein
MKYKISKTDDLQKRLNDRLHNQFKKLLQNRSWDRIPNWRNVKLFLRLNNELWILLKRQLGNRFRNSLFFPR